MDMNIQQLISGFDIDKSHSKFQNFQMKSIYTFFFPLAIGRPGLLTSLENFGQIMEENILKIINNPTGIDAQAFLWVQNYISSSDEQLDYLITHEGLYKFGFDYCDANLDQECLMKDHMAYVT